LKKRARLRLVGKGEGGSGGTGVFDDLDKLRVDMASAEALRPPSGSTAGPASSLRRREVETFARIPHNRALKLYPRRLTGSAWAVLIELDRMILARAAGIRFFFGALGCVRLVSRDMSGRRR
jgi:hypothetical protein